MGAEPLARPTAAAPALRAASMSAALSPTNTSRSGVVPSSAAIQRSPAGSGFGGSSSSPQAITATSPATPSCSSVSWVSARSSFVWMAIGRPAARRRRNAPFTWPSGRISAGCGGAAIVVSALLIASGRARYQPSPCSKSTPAASA